MAEADLSIARSTATKRSDFERERIAVMDAFAQLEAVVARLNPSRIGASLGQRLEGLIGIIPPELHALASELNDVRNDMVHSNFRMIPGAPAYGIYLNFAKEALAYPVARMLTIDQHRALAREVKSLAAKILSRPPAK